MPTLAQGTSLAVALAFVLGAGCGGAATVDAPPSAAPAPSGPSVVVSVAPNKPAMPPVATVKGIATSDKGDHFTRVTVNFENQGGVACTISSYTLVWPGGKKTIGLEAFAVAPGASQIRAIRVHASDGDITNLIRPQDTHVEVESDCK